MRSSMGDLFWRFIWFYYPGSALFFIMMRENLFIATAINTILTAAMAYALFFDTFIFFKHNNLKAKSLSRLSWLLILLNILAVLSIVFSPASIMDWWAIGGSLAYAVALSAIVIIFSNLVDDVEKAIRSLASAYIFGAFLACVLSILLVDNVFSYIGTGARVLVGGVIHSNVISLHATLSLTFLLGGLWGYKKPFVWILVSFFSGVTLLWFSKASLLALLISLLLVFISGSWRQRFSMILLLLIAAILLGGFIIQQVNYYFSRTSAATLSGRTTLWDLTWNLFTERPVLGWGLGTFRRITSSLSRTELGYASTFDISSSHNAYIDSLFQMGILGFVTLVAVLLSAFFLIIRWRRRERTCFSQVAILVWLYLIIRSFVEVHFTGLGYDLALLVSFGLLAEKVLTQRYAGPAIQTDGEEQPVPAKLYARSNTQGYFRKYPG